MDVLKKKNIIYIILILLGALSIISLMFLLNAKQKPFEQTGTIVVVIGAMVFTGFAIYMYAKLKTIRLIIENSILKLNTYVIKDISNGTKQDKAETTDFYISYFGILFENRIIRFNQKGILLKNIEIGPNYFSFTYGKGQQLENIKFVRPFIEASILDDFSKKIYYETGIKAVFMDY